MMIDLLIEYQHLRTTSKFDKDNIICKICGAQSSSFQTVFPIDK